MSDLTLPKRYGPNEVSKIAKKHGVSEKLIEQQLKMGIKVEHEHSPKETIARQIALDHLNEIPDYYTKLAKYVETDKKKIREDFNNFRIKKHKDVSMVFNGDKHVGNIHNPKDTDIGRYRAISKHWGLKKDHATDKDAFNWLVAVNSVGTPTVMGKLANSVEHKGKLVESIMIKSFKVFREELEDKEKRDKEAQVKPMRKDENSEDNEVMYQIKKTDTGEEGNIIEINPRLNRSKTDDETKPKPFVKPETVKTRV